MKIVSAAVFVLATSTAGAIAADIAPQTYTKAAAPVIAPWTGFYIFGGAGSGLWAADDNIIRTSTGLAVSQNTRVGGSGYLGTVGAGYDWQFKGNWVAGLFADGMWGSQKGSLIDLFNGGYSGTETLRTTYSAGARVGYLVAPNVYSYVNAGYTGSEWSGSKLDYVYVGVARPGYTTGSFHRDGYFIGSGVENSLDIFGVHAPGLFMKTEYRWSEFNRIALPETIYGSTTLNGFAATFRPWTQTITTSLVYRFNWTGGPTDPQPRLYTKAASAPVRTNWTGGYIFGGAGGGVWAADSHTVVVPTGFVDTINSRLGGSGYFGTVGAGYDWQFMGNWVAGVFADGTFGSLKGSLIDSSNNTGTESLRTMYAAGIRVGYLVAPNVYSYVNGGYTGSDWSGTTLFETNGIPEWTTGSFHRNGYFVGGGVENSLDIFGIHAPGFFMKTEYRASEFGRTMIPETVFGTSVVGDLVPTFKSWTQTVSTSLVYRFNWSGPVVAKY